MYVNKFQESKIMRCKTNLIGKKECIKIKFNPK